MYPKLQLDLLYRIALFQKTLLEVEFSRLANLIQVVQKNPLSNLQFEFTFIGNLEFTEESWKFQSSRNYIDLPPHTAFFGMARSESQELTFY